MRQRPQVARGSARAVKYGRLPGVQEAANVEDRVSNNRTAGTTGLSIQIDTELYEQFRDKLRADGKTATRVIEAWIAKWLRRPAPERRGPGRQAKGERGAK